MDKLFHILLPIEAKAQTNNLKAKYILHWGRIIWIQKQQCFRTFLIYPLMRQTLVGENRRDKRHHLRDLGVGTFLRRTRQLW